MQDSPSIAQTRFVKPNKTQDRRSILINSGQETRLSNPFMKMKMTKDYNNGLLDEILSIYITVHIH